MALLAIDLFVRIRTLVQPGKRTSHNALTIDNKQRRLPFFFPQATPKGHQAERPFQPFVARPVIEMILYGCPSRKSLVKIAPLGAGSLEPEYAIQDLAKAMLPFPLKRKKLIIKCMPLERLAFMNGRFPFN